MTKSKSDGVDDLTDALKNVKLEETKDTTSTAAKQVNKFGIIGMRDIKDKNIVTDLQT